MKARTVLKPGPLGMWRFGTDPGTGCADEGKITASA
jgi:hypothetical protein